MPYATSEGVRIHYEVEGAGPPLMLHHGIASNIKRWHDCGYVEALRDQYRLIIVDAVGHGESDRTLDPAAFERLHRVRQMLAVLDAEGVERAHFFGYSMGGRVGYALSKYAPARFLSFVIGGASPFRSNARRAFAMRWAGRAFRPLGPLQRPLVRVALRPALRIVRPRASRGQMDTYCAMVLMGIGERGSYRDDIATMSTPTLLFGGGLEGTPILKGMQRAAGLLPSASFVLLPELDHHTAMCTSAVTLQHILPFLAQVSVDAGLLPAGDVGV